MSCSLVNSVIVLYFILGIIGGFFVGLILVGLGIWLLAENFIGEGFASIVFGIVIWIICFLVWRWFRKKKAKAEEEKEKKEQRLENMQKTLDEIKKLSQPQQQSTGSV